MFSSVVVPTYIPTNSVRRFPFLHTSPAFVTCRLFYDGYSDECGMETTSIFIDG